LSEESLWDWATESKECRINITDAKM
jgi:hypothetical protein